MTLNVQNVHRWLTYISAVAYGSLSQCCQWLWCIGATVQLINNEKAITSPLQTGLKIYYQSASQTGLKVYYQSATV